MNHIILSNVIFPVLSYGYLSLVAMPYMWPVVIGVEAWWLRKSCDRFIHAVGFVLVVNLLSTLFGGWLTLRFDIGYDQSYSLKWWICSFAGALILSIGIEFGSYKMIGLIYDYKTELFLRTCAGNVTSYALLAIVMLLLS